MIIEPAVLRPISEEAAEQMVATLFRLIQTDGHTFFCGRYRRESGAVQCLPHCRDIRAALTAAGRLSGEVTST